MSERLCIRECTQPDVHFATCKRHGPEWLTRDDRCRGCAPRVCRDGSLICDRCFGAMARLLQEAPGVIEDLRSKSSPLKAATYDQFRAGGHRAPEGSAPFVIDLLDAVQAIQATLWIFADWDNDLTRMANDVEAISWMASMVLDTHKPINGLREAWSIQDAKNYLRAFERGEEEGDLEDDEVTERGPLSRERVAKLAGISVSTVRRLERAGFVTKHGPFDVGQRRALFYLADVRDGIEKAKASRSDVKVAP